MTRRAIRPGGNRAPSTWRGWQAQGIMAVCLALAFFGPYLLANAVLTHRDRQWMMSGLSLHEIGEWRDNGIHDMHEAVRWRNARFKPPGARLWRDEGVGPEEAAGWHDADFAPREAVRWRGMGFAVQAAGPWRNGGFLPQDARRWRDAGVSPADAVARRKKGEWPR